MNIETKKGLIKDTVYATLKICIILIKIHNINCKNRTRLRMVDEVKPKAWFKSS